MIPQPLPAPSDARMVEFQCLADMLANQELEQEQNREPPMSEEDLRIQLDAEFERILAKSLAQETRSEENDDVDEELEQEDLPDKFFNEPSNDRFFPWPNEPTLLLDILDNLGRCRFTSTQISLIIHLLKRLGVRGVPSLKGLRKAQKQVQAELGSAPVKIISPQGNIFYVSDVRKCVARDFANPLVSPHLNCYPEEVINGPISERWQAEGAVDCAPEQLTPMFSDGQRRWWLNEVARLSDGRFAIPLTWVLRNGKLTSDVYIVTRSVDGVWDCDGTEAELPAELFEADFDDLLAEHGANFVWTERSREFVPAMPNPGRKLGGNRDLYVLGLSVWIDDVSGNKSKQYNKFLVMVMQNTAIPGRLLKQEFHVHFLGASQHVTTAELCAVLRDYVKSTETDPLICYNANTGREAAVILRVTDGDADNPQQSEESSHIGCNGIRPCRKCGWGGPKKDQVNVATYHACHEPGIARTAEAIRTELALQLRMATNGNATAIEKRQKETGTKDKLAQYWIERVLAHVALLKAAEPGKPKAEIAADAQKWLDEQPGDKMNPLLDLAGFDPARDTPVEILHTILLGVVKYIWHHLNTHQWTDTDRHLLAIRLQSTDIAGMNIPAVRGAYMLQYRNNLIGKHYKTIMQALTFHIHDISTPEHFQLVKAAADLGARVWVPVIDDMESYISQLNIAVANLLDAWDAVEPLRILVKIKLHLLPHLPDDIRRLGPAIGFATETHEAHNSVVRACNVNGNNQAPSRDIATKIAGMNNVKHVLCGGWWESAASRGRREKDTNAPREWLQPGDAVTRILRDDPVFQRHLGWVSHSQPVAGVVRFQSTARNPPIPWANTSTSKYWTGPNEPPQTTIWRPALSVTTKTGDVVKVRSWVFVKEDTNWVLGRVAEIVSCTGRVLVLLQRFVHTKQRHPDFDWPVVRPPAGQEITEENLTSFLVVSGALLEFECSVQHDCRRGHCKPAVAGKEQQEREDTTRDISLIKHTDDDHFILNMGSLHNFVQLTRALPPELSKLSYHQTDRLTFHAEMAGKAKTARSSARARAAEKRKATAARRKAEAAKAADEAGVAQEEAERAGCLVDGEQESDDELDEAVAADDESDTGEEEAEDEGQDDDEEYLPSAKGQKRPYYPPPPGQAPVGYPPQPAGYNNYAPQYVGGGGAYAPPPQQPQYYGQYPQPGAPYSYGAPAGYPPPAGAYAPPPGAPQYGAPPGAPQYAPPPGAPQYGAPPGSPYSAPPGAPPTAGAPPPGTPGAYPPPASAPPTSAIVAGYPGAAAPAPGAHPAPGSAPPPQPYAGGMPSAPNAYGMPSGPVEPPTVVYRDIILHNPKYSGGLSVMGYTKDNIGADIRAIMDAGSDEKKLIKILAPMGPLKIEALSAEFHNYNKDNWSLMKWVEKKTTGNVEKTLMGLVQGPLRYDAQIVHSSLVGMGTKESLLNEAILDHSPADIALLDSMYQRMYQHSLWQDVKDDLSGNVLKLFKLVTDPSRKLLPEPTDSAEANRKLLEEDVKALYKGGAGRIGTNEDTFYRIFTSRRHDHLVQICHTYKQQHKRALVDVIKSEFGDGHDSKALQFIVNGAYQPDHPNHSPLAIRDAKYLEKTMEGMGTKNDLLLMRVLRAHWSPGRLQAIKAAYLSVEKKTLPRRIKGETSGTFEDVLLALIGKDDF
ncbi:hypothetical protein MKEN_01443800 [Mycena kentingensis (nom. inval.)]|nr:hypothetical protein MKEN_01443800 [Mycena kentingensis (nom. inval.)]